MYSMCSSHFFGVLLVMLSILFLSSGEVHLSRISKGTINVFVGNNISLIWDYNVTDRSTEFTANSPVWLFEKNGTESKIAFEYQFGTPPWKWTISSECPPQFLNPQRIHKMGVATLVITNVALSDSGKYTCKLDVRSGAKPSSSVQLYAVPKPETTAQPTSSQDVTQPETSGTTLTSTTKPSSITPSTTKEPPRTTASPKTPADKPLGDGAIAGIVVAVVVVILVIIGLVVYFVKKSKNNGDSGSNNKPGIVPMDSKQTGDGNRTGDEA